MNEDFVSLPILEFEYELYELDQIVKEEYGYNYHNSLFEATKDDSDDKYSAPFKRAASFPARAIRYKKAQAVIAKYSNKILRRSEKIVKKFEKELDKSIPQIEKRGKELQVQLERSRKSHNEIEEKTVINLQKKFKADVEENQKMRIQNLNQSLDNLIQVYTQAIHKRIDEPGYVLKVELSDKGKANLKFVWEEYVSTIKQKIYEKLIRMINNKNVKSLEGMIAKFEVEIEDAEDRRRKFRLKADLNKPITKEPEWSVTKGESDEEEFSTAAKKKTLPSLHGELSQIEFDDILKYLEENLPDGIQEEDEPYRILVKIEGKTKVLDAYIETRKEKRTITILLFKIDEDRDEDPIQSYQIEDMKGAQDFVDLVEMGEENKEAEKMDEAIEKYSDILLDFLEILFKTKKKRISEVFPFPFYDDYNHIKKLREFSKFAVGEIISKPKEYSKFFKLIQNESFTDQQLILILLKFRKDFENQEEKEEKKVKENFMSLQNYKKYYL
jgi:hypothetical protein